ncbi:hypothetical protein BCV72DRAFT_107277 [Rhizopus microsporus var. microsporus]|uniref:Uncharacterized protein n=2 Tax=Rhizopus microsporus TaxID=58291 RepID=A0A2G4SG76_RHIZD|nr:uncharacterized protein RHIMIDRAFT_94587 [Rhizopus microsporus ATCC 52813]ORE07562.1 hypothetical protein BCV72DRAFT_107277 [Rhizopus microsporus var. microsporus]PHZ07772.1 hypothetical protein RHIMIDRAFT_94587 [Rhizopus microsporus ATCC 52813]
MSSLTCKHQIEKASRGSTTDKTPPNLTRRDEELFITSFSLPTHYSPSIAEELSNSLPENYTIDHTKVSMASSRTDDRYRDRKDPHKCNDRGKIYKHRNYLTKHQWEIVSKFLLTKHQQVEMLEAAIILMNLDKKNNYWFRKSNTKEESDIDIEIDDI